jgi:hypothetical protein
MPTFQSRLILIGFSGVRLSLQNGAACAIVLIPSGVCDKDYGWTREFGLWSSNEFRISRQLASIAGLKYLEEGEGATADSPDQ